MIHQKGNTFVNSAGNNEKFIKIMDAAQKKMDKKLKFIPQNQDLLTYIHHLEDETHTQKGEVVFTDQNNQLQYFPCVTKFISFVDSNTSFPKDKKRNPFECAKIQYLLCKNSNVDINNIANQNNIAKFQCSCRDCYLMAIHGAFETDKLCF